MATVVLLAAPAERAVAQTGSGPVNIPDSVLRGALETALGKTPGETITCAEMADWSFGNQLNFTRTSADDRDNPGGAVRNLTGLECATRLNKLFLQYNRVSDLTPLAGLLDLTVLDLRNNRVRDISPLRGLIYLLRSLYLDNNQISDLSPLGRIYSLVSLTLAGNRISDLSPLARLAGRNGQILQDLTLSDNDITDLSPLRGLTSLQYLHLYRNRITDLSPLQGMTALKILSLSGNQGLSDLRPLSGINSLTNLHLESTSINDLKPLVDIAGLGSGDVVNIRDNQRLNDPTNPKAADNADHITTLRGRGVTVAANLGTDRTIRGLRVTPGPREESLTVAWDRVTGASGYRVYWRSGWQALSSRVTPPRHHNTGSGTTTSYVIEDLTPGTEYSVAAATYPPFGVLSGEVSCHAPAAPPGQVTGVAVTRGVKSLSVSWDSVPGATIGYKVQWKSSGEQDYDRAARQSPPSPTTPDPCGPRQSDGMRTTSYTIDASIVPGGLTPGDEYTVRVIATKDHASDGEPSDEATGTPLLSPPTVDVRRGVESLDVSWNLLADADGYTVQWKSGSQAFTSGADPPRHKDFNDADTTTWTIPDLRPGTEYTVRVIATTAGVSDRPSDEATGTPLTASAPTVAVTPNVESLDVSWDRLDDADGYTVQWKSGSQAFTSGADPPRHKDFNDADTTTWTIPDLDPDTEYTVRVIPTRGGVRGEPSEEKNGAPLRRVGKVENVTVEPGVESLMVSWSPVADADGYTVQWRSGSQTFTSRADPPRHKDIDDADATTWTIPDLDPDTEYTVRVIPTRGGVRGEPSEEKNGAPLRRVGVSVADAAAVEGAVVEFPLRLTEPSAAVVTLTWVTEEGGTAQAGEDYRVVSSGSLTLQPGDAAGTLRVRTLDDGRVEPAETFRVRLTDVTNAYVEPRAGSATGTITDNDTEPVRARALGRMLAGMGRWIAADAVEVIEGRFAGGEAVEAELGLDGRMLPLPGAGSREPAWSAAAGRTNEWTPWTPEKEASHPALSAESLSRSRFNLPLGQRDAGGELPGLRAWGRGSAGGFDGRPEAGFRMDGDMVGGYLGLDYRPRPDALVGVALARSGGDVDYEIDEVTTGTVDLELTSVLPYALWSPRADLELWGLLGTGWGAVELEDEIGEVETDLKMRMAAFGLRQEVGAWREVDVALKSDAFLVGLKTDARAGLPKARGGAERLRLRLEGRMQRTPSPVSQLTPSLEIGGRWDGGDADTGMGLEVGGGVAYAHETLGLEVEARGRYLLAHRESAFDEWGGSLTAKLDPGQAGRGPWMTLAPGWGAEGSRVAQMWESKEVFRAPGGGDGAELSPDRLDLELGYGLARGSGGRLTPWAGLSMAGSAPGYKLGARMEAGSRMSLELESRWPEARGHEVMLYGRLDW